MTRFLDSPHRIVAGRSIKVALCAALACALALPGIAQSAATSTPSVTTAAQPTPSAVPGQASDCGGVPCSAPQPHITVVNPPAQPAPWPLRDRISWIANVVLAILGYVGIWLAVSTLRKIERQTQAAETAAEAAAESAQAALLQAQSLARAERPWILVTAKPSPGAENSFDVVATNRGRTPARIVTLADDITLAVDESHLPAHPAFSRGDAAPVIPIFLLPGESAVLKTFARADVKTVCATAEKLARVENWEEKIYLYGRVTYRDLTAPATQPAQETQWCCWYIHGRQKSGLVIAGPPAYNAHT